MIYIKNKSGNQVEEADDAQLEDIVNSGQYQVEDKDYEFEDLEGNRKLLKPGELKQAFNVGFKYIPEQQRKLEALKEKYGDSALKAALVSAAGGATLGILPPVMEKAGLLEKGEVEGLRIANPVASTIGEVGGGVASVVASSGTGLAAKVASKLPTAMLAKGASAVGNRAAMNITSNIAKKAVELGVEGAVEGAVYGGVSALTEEALGDKEFNAEAILAKAGTGAVAGLVIGGALGAGSQALSMATRKAKDTIKDKMILNQIKGDDVITKKEILDKFADDAAKEEGILALKNPEIMRIKEIYPDAPTTPGMESAYKTITDIENMMIDSPSPEGVNIAKKANEIKDYVESKVDEIFSGAKEASKEESGDLIRQSLFVKINEPWESGKAYYNALMNEFGGAPVQRAQRTRVLNEIKKSDSFRLGSEGAEIKKLMGILEDSQDLTLRQVKELQSEIGAAAKFSKSPSERNLLNSMYEKVRMLQDNSIRQAVKGAKDQDAAKKIIRGLDAANADYVRAYKAKEEIADAFGVKGSSFEDVLDKLENMSSVRLDEKFMNTKYSDKARSIIEKYPDLGKLVLANRQAKVINKHLLNDGTINYSGLKKTFQKMDKDERMLYFMGDEKQYQKFLDMVTLYENRPKTLNPSGTDVRSEVRAMLNPRRWVENAAFKQIYYGSDSFIGKMVNKVMPNLAGIENASNSVKDNVVKSTNGFFRSTVPGIGILSVSVPSDEKLKKTEKTYRRVMEDPESYIKDYMDKNRDLQVSAPGTSSALQTKMIAATQFLKSKIPQVDDGYIGQQRQPSKIELTKFADYVDAVENPMMVLKNIQKGYVSPAQIEAIKAVYPKIYAALQAELMNKMPKNLSRTQRSQLQLLLGSRVTPAMSQTGFSILQGKSPQIQQLQKASIKPTMSGLDKIDKSGRTKTGLDKVLSRS